MKHDDYTVKTTQAVSHSSNLFKGGRTGAGLVDLSGGEGGVSVVL